MSTWFGLTFICRIHLEKLLQQESIAIIEFLQYLQTNQCTSFHRSIRATDDWQHPFVISLCKSSFRQLHYSSSSLWAPCRWMLTAAIACLTFNTTGRVAQMSSLTVISRRYVPRDTTGAHHVAWDRLFCDRLWSHKFSFTASEVSHHSCFTE